MKNGIERRSNGSVITRKTTNSGQQKYFVRKRVDKGYRASAHGPWILLKDARYNADNINWEQER